MSELKFRPVKNVEELDQIFSQAKEDGHVVVAPTHSVTTPEGELRGALSFLPTVLVWMHTKRNGVRDTLELKKFIENHLGANGAVVACIPCLENSPYFEVLPKMGYMDIGNYHFFVKGL